MIVLTFKAEFCCPIPWQLGYIAAIFNENTDNLLLSYLEHLVKFIRQTFIQLLANYQFAINA